MLISIWCHQSVGNFEEKKKAIRSACIVSYIRITAACTCWRKLAETANPASLIAIAEAIVFSDEPFMVTSRLLRS